MAVHELIPLSKRAILNLDGLKHPDRMRLSRLVRLYVSARQGSAWS